MTTSTRAARTRTVLALLLAAASGALLAIAVAGLLSAPACGEAGQGRCDQDVLLLVPALAGGIALSLLSAFLGAGAVSFSACFLGVAVGSVLRADEADLGAFPLVFGGVFATLGLLPPAIALALRPRMRARRRTLAALEAESLTGLGTVTSVEDTGVSVNEDPLARITVTVRPDGGGPLLLRSTTTLVPRVAIPRIGDLCAVRWLPDDEAAVLLDFRKTATTLHPC